MTPGIEGTKAFAGIELAVGGWDSNYGIDAHEERWLSKVLLSSFQLSSVQHFLSEKVPLCIVLGISTALMILTGTCLRLILCN